MANGDSTPLTAVRPGIMRHARTVSVRYKKKQMFRVASLRLTSDSFNSEEVTPSMSAAVMIFYI